MRVPAGHAQGGPLAPPSTGGIARLDWLLQRLTEPRRVLVIAAHPDDEDTALLTLASRGYGADAGYLSLSRGEGGQNLIGTELGVALGLVRTRELEAARAIDGAEQYFARAFDFGYTRSLDETEGRWVVDSVFKDVVRVVRRFQPHVIVATFSGTARDGHGQHQFAGVMARRAYAAAGDPTVFPELAAEEGLAPWLPAKLYRSTRFDRDATTLQLDAAGLDPRTGRTVHQIAMESRSQHRSQDFGVLQDIGPATVSVALVESRVGGAPDTALFAGVPIADTWLGGMADSLRRTLSPATLGDAVPALAAALQRLRREGEPRRHAERLLTEAMAIAAGLLVDARTAEGYAVAGAPVGLAIAVRNAGGAPVSVDRAVLRVRAGGWTDDVALQGGGALPPGGYVTIEHTLRVPPSAEPTRPYFAARPLQGALYDWSGVEPAVRGLPHQPPPLVAQVHVTVAGVPLVIEREVTVRQQDQAVGELRRPFVVLPAVNVVLSPDTAFWPLADTGVRVLDVQLEQTAADTVRGTLRMAVNGRVVAERPVTLAHAGARQSVSIRIPAGAGTGDLQVSAELVTGPERSYREGAVTVGYPHIRPLTWVRPAAGIVRTADAVLPRRTRIGYVRGASDRVPEALIRAGLPLTVLDSTVLTQGDLGAWDVIVIGSRAYETEPALVTAHDRLMAWVRGGGHLVVQYQQYQYVRGGFAPFPFRIANPHDRVTDEASPVTVLEPGHAAFRRPNRIGAPDWEGWPQERGLYFANTWDRAYTPLLELRDPEGRPVRGGLLVASVGRGTYIYTGLSFFRALPAGVPGAFRLFFNLLEVGIEG